MGMEGSARARWKIKERVKKELGKKHGIGKE